jgi:energy-converting hydrogenase B subunit D
MLTWMALVIVVVMLAAAVLVLTLRSFVAAVAATSVVGLALSVLYVLLQAPDVAMTEAAVGAGLSGVILALALRRLGLWQLDDGDGVGPKPDSGRARPGGDADA